MIEQVILSREEYLDLKAKADAGARSEIESAVYGLRRMIESAALVAERNPMGSMEYYVTYCRSKLRTLDQQLDARMKGGATKSRRYLFRLVPSIRHRTGRESGFWATAQSRDGRGVTQKFQDGSLDALPNQPKVSLWPTAQAAQALGGQRNRGGDRKDELLLGGILRTALWPTARQEDSQCAGAHRGNPDSVYPALKVSLWRAPGKEDTGRGPSLVEARKAGGHAIHFADELKTYLGRTTNGSLAPTLKEAPSFASLQLAFTMWLMGYSPAYLKAWGQSSSEHSATPSAGPSQPKS